MSPSLEASGIPCPIRSAGGTSTWRWTAAFPGITEIQAGGSVVMDNYHGQLAPGFEHSLTIQASVLSRPSDRVIVDSGNRSAAAAADVTMADRDLEPVRFDEEHDIFAAPDGSPAPPPGPGRWNFHPPPAGTMEHRPGPGPGLPGNIGGRMRPAGLEGHEVRRREGAG